MKKIALVLIFFISVGCLSGCKRINLDQQTEEAYVEYAVNAVINHDKNNMLKLERVDIENEEETMWIPDSNTPSGEQESSSDTSIDINIGDTTTSQLTYVSFEEALGNASLSVKVNGVKECDTYPENSDNLAFVMTASTGSRLVVLEMSITNVSGDTIKLDTIDDFSFKGIFNGVVRTNALTTILDYALNNNVHTIESGKTKEVVLIYELNNERIAEVDKIVISVTRNDETYNVNVK